MLKMLKQRFDDYYYDYVYKEGVRVSILARPYVENIGDMAFPFGRRNCRWSPVPSPIGNGERSIFEERIENGKRSLVVTGKENLKDFIEASKAETLISNIMKRFEQGDVNALSRVQGFYGDVTSMPTNLADAQKVLINLETQFNSLPVDVRQKFDNSFDKYVQEVSNVKSVDEFNTLFNIQPSTPVESEVVSNDKE